MSVLHHSVLSLVCDFRQVIYVLGQFSSSEQSGQGWVYLCPREPSSRDLLGFDHSNQCCPNTKLQSWHQFPVFFLFLVHFPPLGGACACLPQGPSTHTLSFLSPSNTHSLLEKGRVFLLAEVSMTGNNLEHYSTRHIHTLISPPNTLTPKVKY